MMLFCKGRMGFLVMYNKMICLEEQQSGLLIYGDAHQMA
jgi:hypothetical protein